MSFQDFWKKAKKVTVLGIENIKSTQLNSTDNPLKDSEFVLYSDKFSKTTTIMYDTLRNFQNLTQNIKTLTSHQQTLARAFIEDGKVNITEASRFQNSSQKFAMSVHPLIQKVSDNPDLNELTRKRENVSNLCRIQEKLKNNLLLKGRAEEKITKLIANGTQEKRQEAQVEFDKRYEKVTKYEGQFQDGVMKLEGEVSTAVEKLAVFFTVIVEQFVNAARTDFIPDTVSVEAFIGRNSSDDEEIANLNKSNENESEK